VVTDQDRDRILRDPNFVSAGKHLSYMMRHSNLWHEDGSLSLNELLAHARTAKKIQSMFKHSDSILKTVCLDDVPHRLRNRMGTFEFLMPFAHLICDSNKARCMVGFQPDEDFTPGTTPNPDTWFMPARFYDDQLREEQADYLDGHNITSIFFRFESGHSKPVNLPAILYESIKFSNNYLIHGTNEKNLQSIQRNGLLPGGTRGGRCHVHFALDFLMTTMLDAIRPENDVILFLRNDAIDDLGPIKTSTSYVLTDQTVPWDRTCGVWSLIDQTWIKAPPPEELDRMRDYGGDVETALHLTRYQIYYNKMNKNSDNNLTWDYSEYTHYLTGQMSDMLITESYLNKILTPNAAPSRPIRQVPTPNDMARGPPRTDQEKRTDRVRQQLIEYFQRRVKKETDRQQLIERFQRRVKKETDRNLQNINISDSSDSEYVAHPVQPILAKQMPVKVPKPPPAPTRSSGSTDTPTSVAKSKAVGLSPAETPAQTTDADLTAPESDSAPADITATARKRTEVRKSSKMPTSNATELFKDAESAQKVFDDFNHEFETTAWWPRPIGPQCCSNFETCKNDNSMLWCHACGQAFCLQCRRDGRACSHHVVNYSSEVSAEFMPDSIGAEGSTVDIQELLETVLSNASVFGPDRDTQSRTRKENFDDLMEILKTEKRFGNTVLQSFARNGIEDFDFANFVYDLEGDERVPSIETHYVDCQDEKSLPIWRPEIFFSYPEDSELSDDEVLGLLELFRTCMLGKRAAQGIAIRTSDNMAETQKDSYQLGILSLNLGAINRIPYIAGKHRFPSWVRKDIQYRALLYLVFRNVAHIVTLCEAHDAHGGIAAHQQAAAEHGMMGMVVHPESNSQSLAIFVRGDASFGTFIELLVQHQYETENKEDKNKFWIIRGCLFRISFGRNTSGEFMNPRTGVREPMPNVDFNEESLISPHPEPLASSNDASEQIIEIQGKSDVVECELLPVGSDSVTHSVHRLGLAEIRIAVFHLSSYAWTWAYAETCKRWLNFIACCINYQIDFITGDGNLFSQRNFKRDDRSDFRSSILMDILERFLIQINLHRNPVNAITYNVVSSTMASEYIRAMQGESANCDPMILISLCYGKQVGVTEARAKGDAPPDDGVPTSGFDDEVTLADVEHLKHLLIIMIWD